MVDFYEVKCTRVIDGDTFVGDISLKAFNITVHDQHFRLYGVNTPERKQDLYKEAKEFTTEQLEGKSFVVNLLGKDSFGRWLTDVFLQDNELFNGSLIQNGLAVKFMKK